MMKNQDGKVDFNKISHITSEGKIVTKEEMRKEADKFIEELLTAIEEEKNMESIKTVEKSKFFTSGDWFILGLASGILTLLWILFLIFVL